MLNAEHMFRTRFDNQAQYDTFVEAHAKNLTDDGTRPAYVSAGRWVADCDCGAGIGCPSPEWGTHGACMECGNRYRLEWPDDLAEIETVLAARPAKAQHWRPGESVGQLARENELMSHELKVN